MNVKKIPVESIDAGERLRSLNPVYVADIAASYQLKGGEGRGQITPIEVREAGQAGRFRLISGYHRLEAAKISGWKTISASVVTCTNDEAELREIDENLVRHELSALDRAAFMARREAIWAAAHPDSTSGRIAAMARWHASDMVSFASDAAKKLGISPRTVGRWLHLAQATAWLSGADRARIAASDIAQNQSELMALSGIEDAGLRGQVIDLLLSGEGAPRKVAAAVRQLAGGLAEPVRTADVELAEFLNRWAKWSEAGRQKIREHIEFERKNAKPRRVV